MTNDRTIMSLPIASIAIPERRIGFYDARHAANLGASFLAEGQHDPIHVKRNGNAAKLPWTLVAGLHRLRGMDEIGRDAIDAIQVADARTDAAALRRLELSENLDHRQRRPIERAIFMVERARLEEEADHPGRVGETPQARAGRARQAASIPGMDAAGWRERTATAMGCSIPTLERYQRIHRAIVEALANLAERLNFHPLGESRSAMIDLAKLPMPERLTVATLIVNDQDLASVGEAMARAGLRDSNGTRHDPAKSHVRWRDDWNSMSREDQHANLLDIAKTVPPSWVQETIDVLTGMLP